MKPRRVMLMIEVETDVALKDIRKPGNLYITVDSKLYISKELVIKQVQANVVKK